MDEAAERDGRGRFQPGRSGNPKGKPPGTLNRATVLRGFLRDGEHAAAARIVIDQACGGDGVAARFLLGLLEAKPRSRPLPLELAEADDVAGARAALLQAFAAGAISPEEGLAGLRFLDQLSPGQGDDAAARRDPGLDERDATIERLERENATLRAALAAARRDEDVLNSTCISRTGTDAPPSAPPDDATPDAVPAAPAVALNPACISGSGTAVSPSTRSREAAPDAPTTAPPQPADALNSTCISRSGTGAPPPAPVQPGMLPPSPPAPPGRRRSAVRYWAGKQARG